MEPEQEAALADLEEEVKARAIAELDEQEMQLDCEENAAEESRGQPLTVAGLQAAPEEKGSANTAAASITEDADLAAEIDKERDALRRGFEEVEPAIGRRHSSGDDSKSHADPALLAQRQASRQRDRAEPWFADLQWGPFAPP